MRRPLSMAGTSPGARAAGLVCPLGAGSAGSAGTGFSVPLAVAPAPPPGSDGPPMRGSTPGGRGLLLLQPVRYRASRQRTPALLLLPCPPILALLLEPTQAADTLFSCPDSFSGANIAPAHTADRTRIQCQL